MSQFKNGLIAVAAGVVMSSAAFAAVPHSEGFEDPSWVAGPGTWQNYSGGNIYRVVSGTDGIASSQGGAHAIITDLSINNDVFGNPSLGALSPYTNFGGYSPDFGGGYSTSLDIYLDPAALSDGQGFDYTSAINNNSGGHLRDFIWHVGVVGGKLLLNASNNTDYSFNAGKITSGGNAYQVTDAGWYTFEHHFYDNGGTLAVDLVLLNSLGDVIHTITRTTSDDIANVGGNRYGWFAYNNIDRLAIDGTQVVPAPGALALFSFGGLAAVRRRRR